VVNFFFVPFFYLRFFTCVFLPEFFFFGSEGFFFVHVFFPLFFSPKKDVKKISCQPFFLPCLCQKKEKKKQSINSPKFREQIPFLFCFAVFWRAFCLRPLIFFLFVFTVLYLSVISSVRNYFLIPYIFFFLYLSTAITFPILSWA
jgi:hypothetical protein